MISTLCDIVDGIANFFVSFLTLIGGLDTVFFIALAVEVVLVVFFLIKSAYSYEASLNRALDKLNFWLFEKKNVTEENIKDLNLLFKTKAPKRLCYYWQQYILFREGNPSTYLSTENLVEKPLKTSSYNSNIKNLTLFSCVWALIVSVFVLFVSFFDAMLTGKALVYAILLPIFVALIATIFVVYLRARKNSILNSLYQNVGLFGRFMDNACIDLPSYIDYQILFTPQEIEKGQPVLREFLDYKARKEKEAFNLEKEEYVDYETYDFIETGVDGSIVLDRAMKESELFLKKKEKILVKISQLEAELDSRRKNFDNVQKDYQTKIQASKENVNRLRQMQEETTNRIESNYYRKQQTQEIAKQEQFEQEFEQLRAKYLLEKDEGEEEIQKLNNELAVYKTNVENAMIGEYQTFFDKFCHSAEKVVSKVFNDKISSLKEQSEKDKQKITELEIKLKNIPQGVYDADKNPSESNEPESEIPAEGKYDENGNYVYPNGTFYDKDGNFHDEKGDIYSQDGTLISKATDSKDDQKPETKIVDFDDFDSFDFMTDASQKENIYSVAENVIKEIDKDEEIKVVNNTEKDIVDFDEEDEADLSFKPSHQEDKEVFEEESFDEAPILENVEFDNVVNETPKKKPGRPRKILDESPSKPAGKRGRPRKVVDVAGDLEPKKVGRPKKIENEIGQVEKKKVGRPKKIVKEEIAADSVKRGRGRPKKQTSTISEINQKLHEEEEKLNEMRSSLNKDLEFAMNEMNTNSVDENQIRRNELIKEIDALQNEAQDVIKRNEPESRIVEINAKLEKLLNEIKSLN